jgi:hypothetical protein
MENENANFEERRMESRTSDNKNAMESSLYNVLDAIRDNKIIVITEEDKIAEALNNLLEESMYFFTSINYIKDISYVNNCKIYVLNLREDYIQAIKDKLYTNCKVFKIVNLKESIINWLNGEHTKKELV